MTSKVCCDKMRKALEDKECPIGYLRRSDALYSGYGCPLKRFKYRDDIVRPVVPIAFCPWCAAEQEFAFEIRLENKLFWEYKKHGMEYPENGFRFDSPYYENKIPEIFRHLCRDRTWYYSKLKKRRAQHSDTTLCEFFEDNEPGDCLVTIYYTNARFFGIIRKTVMSYFKYCKFIDRPPEELVPIDFCYECGAKLPERLDGKLTEILQKEYGLQSWKDYKKAPHEFHTDEWWKKRGL